MTYSLLLGDCLEVMKTMEAHSVDAIVCDPPAGIAFMNKSWDKDKGGRRQWIAWMTEIAAECVRVIRPGGHAFVWALPRTSHWTATAWEDGGFEIRDCVYQIFGSGFPKSHNVSVAIDKHGGQSVSWFGPWLKNWRTQNGITQKQISALFPSVTGGLTGCVANWELGFNMPTPEQFNLICQTFGLPFESLEEAEREVIGQDTKARSTNGKSALPTMGAPVEYQTWDITAPATDAAKQYSGFGSALKPAVECWWLLRAPLSEPTIAQNVLRWNCGALNIDCCRVEGAWTRDSTTRSDIRGGAFVQGKSGGLECEPQASHPAGRWPPNLLLDPEAAALLDQMSGERKVGGERASYSTAGHAGLYAQGGRSLVGYGDTGGASRFFPIFAHDDEPLRMCYQPKASKRDRSSDGTVNNTHPTCKPQMLMRWLAKLITCPGGTILDPFMGSGTTGVAAMLEGFNFIGIDNSEEYLAIAEARCAHAAAQYAAARVQPGLFDRG